MRTSSPKRLLACLALFLSVLFVYLPAQAQLAGSGAIEGRITDATGAVIPGASVTAVDTATGVSTTRASTSAGIYTLSPLAIGNYTLTVTVPGFQTAVQEHIQVNATEAVGLDFKMKVGQQTDKVTISTAPPALETTNATLGEVIQNDTYEKLPLIMNQGPLDPTAFVTLLAGVSNIGRSGVFNGAGGSGGQTDEIYVDGVPLTNIDTQGDNRSIQLGMSIDTVDQFQVITSGGSVQYDGMGATNWNIKGGTNTYHGSAYVAFRNTAFDTWGFFPKAATVTTLVNGVKTTAPAPKPSEHQDEESIAGGGPVRIPHLYDGRNKLFFFGSYVHYHQTKGINPTLDSVPTTLERQGIFTQLTPGVSIYDPTTNNATACLTVQASCSDKQFMGMMNGVATPNVIPAGEISPQAQYIQSFLPPANNDNVTTNNFLTGVPTGNLNYTVNGRIDYQIDPKQRFSFVASLGYRTFIPCDGCGPFPVPYAGGTGVTEKVDTVILEHEYTLTPHSVNSFRYAFNRFWDVGTNLTQGIPQYESGPGGVGITNLPPGEASLSFPAISFSGVYDVPTSWSDTAGNIAANNTYDLVDNLIWTHGKHTTTYGAVFQWLQANTSTHSTATGPMSYGFSNSQTAGYTPAGVLENTAANSTNKIAQGNPYATFLIGAVGSDSVSITPYSTLGARYKNFSPYLQDDWRVNSRLTINAGIRWDIYTPFKEVQNRWSFLNPLLLNPATGTLGALEFAGYGPDSCDCRTPLHTYYGNVGPRLGMAYSVNSKTVIRVGGGIQFTHTGGVGGHGGSTNGTGQVGLTQTANFPSLGANVVNPAFYLNNSAYFQANGIANTGLPPYTAVAFASPVTDAGNYINNGNNPQVATGTAVTTQSMSYGDFYYGGRGGEATTWNAGIQRAITNDLTLEVDYAGSESHFLVTSGSARGSVVNQLNPMYITLGPILSKLPTNTDPATSRTYLQDVQAAFPGTGYPFSNFGGPNATIQSMLESMPQYGGISDTFGVVGNAAYNSVQVKFSLRPHRGLSYTLNYTYSKETDDTGTFRSGWAIPGYAITDGIPRGQDKADYARGTGDFPQILHLYGVWEMPFGKGHNRFVNALTGGWSFSSIYTYNSGAPLAITGSGCPSTGQGTCMPSYRPGYAKSPRIGGGWGKGVTAANAGTHPYIDATAFVIPTTYQIGNLARTAPYNLFGPSTFDMDAGLSRKFKIAEGVTFIFNATATNVFNNVIFGVGGLAVNGDATVGGVTAPSNASTFGIVSSQTNASRDFQFSGRISF